METTRLKGFVVRDMHEALVEIAGEEAVRVALAGLPEPERREYADPSALSWVRITVIEQVFKAVARHIERDVVALNRELTRISADRSVKSLFRILLKLASPDTAIARAASAYGRVYDRGRLTVRAEGNGRTAVELRGRPGMSAVARDGFGIALETIVKQTGASNVRVASTGHQDGADYIVTWRV